jgi:nucleoid-associated protein YgaU
MAVGIKGSPHLAQANTRTASSTEVILTSTLSVAAAPATATSHTTRYVVQDGDTLSGIAARFAVRGGWPALYAANRRAIGPDPDVIHAGAVLVLPGHRTPARYTVAAGDTLSGIAARFAVRGGWPALYAANRRAIGPDPDAIHAGTVLRLPRPAAPSPPPAPGGNYSRPHPPAPPAGPRHHPRPVAKRAPAPAGMPRWLEAILLADGLLILAALLTAPVLAARRRRRQAAARKARAREARARQAAAEETAAQDAAAHLAAVQETTVQPGAVQALQVGEPGPDPGPGCWRPCAGRAHIVLADYDRLIVTRSTPDDTIYVLRPPGEDPKAILRVARLVLPEGPYRELARRLGLPAIGPVD